jgi:hypothetical protein
MVGIDGVDGSAEVAQILDDFSPHASRALTGPDNRDASRSKQKVQ